MTSPHVTVLTAVYNGEKHIAETIRCIQAQTYTDWEYIIVDDASSDNTPCIVDEFAQQDMRIRLLRLDTNGGPFVAANQGLRQARGKYIVRIDGDDLSPRVRIAKQLAFLEATDYRACITPWHSFDERGIMPGGKVVIPVRDKSLRWYLAFRSFASHSSLCIERSALEELGGYREERAAQDYRLLTQLSQRNWVGIIPEVLSFVRRYEYRISKVIGGEQHRLGLLVLQDHIRAITGDTWLLADVENLQQAAATSLSLAEGLAAIAQWERLWCADSSLDEADRRELAFFTAYHKWKLIHQRLKKQPGAVMLRTFSSLLAGRSSLRAGYHYFLTQYKKRTETRQPLSKVF
ncbi:MAG: glycosyltransferase family 2 protein [Anaerolineae bacterium]|nr:glycosyltransferase family 2 protein [Anaerolineae bacterium]